MAKQPLHPQAQRLRTIIWSAPLMVGCGCTLNFFPRRRRNSQLQYVPDVLYRRMILGEEQRKFANDTPKPKLGISPKTQQDAQTEQSSH